ncbi:WD repeat-containing protein 3 [Smittium culicis]|uniref:WD repeat-containing protein 3 n=1 Tax=Smittium culicis TaxID=133412 RepID=A0A1R1XRN4_9FUNG|nr:WD repeat-containing protein 3 [Smittium culicis]
MVKAYQRYEAASCFGVIASPSSNSIYSTDGKYALSPALQDVLVWDLKKGELYKKFSDIDNTSQVTFITSNITANQYAIGYFDGSIRIFSFESPSPLCIFNGHKSAITALSYDSTGTILCSGSRDTDLVLWDIIAETGLFRLKGHKDQITGISFLNKPIPTANSSSKTNTTFDIGDSIDSLSTSNHDLTLGAFSAGEKGYLITCSKDTLIKVWDLELRHCIQTVVSHKSEVWSMAICPESKTLISGSSESSLKVFSINTADSPPTESQTSDSSSIENSNSENLISQLVKKGNKEILVEIGYIPRQSKERVTMLQFHPAGILLGCQTNDRMVEFFSISSPDEIKRRSTRKLKRLREKTSTANNLQLDPENEISSQDLVSFTYIQRQIIRLAAKSRSFSFSPDEKSQLIVNRQKFVKILFSLVNNSLSVASLPILSATQSDSSKSSKQSLEPTWIYSIERLGHRSEPRCIALSSNNELIATACSTNIRIWNSLTNVCITTLECLNPLSICFLPGDQHIAVGTKSGTIELFDLAAAGSPIASYDAHENGCYSIAVFPDKSGIATGGGDKESKFWDFELIEPKSKTSRNNFEGSDDEQQVVFAPNTRVLNLVHTRTLKLPDIILSIAISNNSKLIAYSLLDTTIKVFFFDSLKFSLSLYGHKLPALSIDISSDSSLLISGSADKNVKIWGLDFGDCHKSIHAHKDAITSVKFVFDTHYFFTSSKDGNVNMYDADKFVKIQTLVGGSDVWGIVVAKFGNFVAAVSQDRSIRTWNKTDEPLFLEEERENELEKFHDDQMVASANKDLSSFNELSIGDVDVNEVDEDVMLHTDGKSGDDGDEDADRVASREQSATERSRRRAVGITATVFACSFRVPPEVGEFERELLAGIKQDPQLLAEEQFLPAAEHQVVRAATD